MSIHEPASELVRRTPLRLLTSLRFFAAMEVVIFRCTYGRIESGNPIWGFRSGGYEAVTFFFILSGFILTYVYVDQSVVSSLRGSPREFWKARIARIVPVYYAGLCLSLPILLYSTFISRITSSPDLLTVLALAPTFLQSWWAPVAFLWNSPGWSLSVECFFYASFPLLAVLTARLRPRHYLVVAYCMVLAAEAVKLSSTHFVLETLGLSNGGNFLNCFPLFHLPSFLAGMAIGRAYVERKDGHRFSKRWRSIFLLCAALIIFLFGFRTALPALVFQNAQLVPLFSMLIYSGACAESSLGILTHPILVTLGEASYAIYIVHSPFLFWWNWFWNKLAKVDLPPIADFLASMVALITISYFLLVLVETPLRRKILGHPEHRNA